MTKLDADVVMQTITQYMNNDVEHFKVLVHQLRNHLARIVGTAEIIKDDLFGLSTPDDTPDTQVINRIHASTNLMTCILNKSQYIPGSKKELIARSTNTYINSYHNILETKQKLVEQARKYTIGDIADHVEQAYDHMRASHEISFRAPFTGDFAADMHTRWSIRNDPGYCEPDLKHVQTKDDYCLIVDILYDNSVQAAEKNHKDFFFNVQTQMGDEETLEVAVTDKSGGYPDLKGDYSHDLQRVMRAPESTKQGKGGFGTTYAKKLIERNGGTYRRANTQDGSQTTFTIPVYQNGSGELMQKGYENGHTE